MDYINMAVTLSNSWVYLHACEVGKSDSLWVDDWLWEQASPPSLHSPPLLERQHWHNKQNKARLILGPFSGEGGGSTDLQLVGEVCNQLSIDEKPSLCIPDQIEKHHPSPTLTPPTLPLHYSTNTITWWQTEN